MAEQVWNELPEPVRARLAEFASLAVRELPISDVPPPLRKLARFTPGKRARLGGRLLVTQLEESAAFRTAVLAWWTEHRPEELSGPEVDAISEAAALVLSGSEEASDRLAAIAEKTDLSTVRAERDTALSRVDKLTAELDRVRAELTDARAAVREANAARGDELARLRQRVREQGMQVRAARDEAKDALRELVRCREEAAHEVTAAQAERDRAEARLSAEKTRASRVVSEASEARQVARETRQADDARLQLLLDTLSGAVAGLRGELALDTGGRESRARPADLVGGASRARPRSPRISDASALDRVLALRSVHLIVDGYNVSKTGYPELTLFDQRTRLVGALSSVVARTGAEVTVVFDGAAVVATGLARYPRGVRVLFSAPGVLADDVIRELVAAEPAGRPVVVATSDRAVAESIQRDGAHPMGAEVLLALLNRF
jgi:predicted RNA-binding protein with PIN domain